MPKAVDGCDYVLNQAALGSVPCSINDPITTYDLNIGGLLNMLVAARDAKVKRFMYAASSSTYCDSEVVPMVEDVIGRSLSTYAITKYVNKLYADVFAKTYQMKCIGLRYFNVFGKRQDPNGEYAAVIPLWVKKMINLEPQEINDDGTFSLDFTYVANVVQANERAMLTPSADLRDVRDVREILDLSGFSQVFNVAFGGNTTLNELHNILRSNLARYKPEITFLNPIHAPKRKGDIPHSLASVEIARKLINYNPQYSPAHGFELVCD